MKSRRILFATVIVGAFWVSAAAEPKKTKIQVDAPAVESILAGTSIQSNAFLANLPELKPKMPLGPQDVLKSYEVAMNILADRTSSDFLMIVQAQQANQITREQAEYLLQQRYETAMMQYQVLSALHDVLNHEIDEASQQGKHSVKTTRSDPVLVVPVPGFAAAAR
jgi:hypothetical protein